MTKTNKIKIAVTGDEGFLGKHLIKVLKTRGLSFTTFDRTKYNLLNPESLKGFVTGKDVIIHLAGANRNTNFKLSQTNTLGTVGLLSAIAEYSPKTRLIYASSSQIYLDQSYYGLSKRQAEELLHWYRNNAALDTLALRFSNLYGPGGKPFYNSVIATFASLINEGKTISVNGDGKQERDYLYVDDAVEAIIKATLHQGKFETAELDICSGTQTSLNKLLEILKSVCPQEIPVEYKKTLSGPEWRINKDNQSAKELLGWQPTTSLRQGLINSLGIKTENTLLQIKKLVKHQDSRGMFAEVLRPEDIDNPAFGQMSINVTSPGETKGGHYHLYKREWFCVVRGKGLLILRDRATKKRKEIILSEDKLRVVEIPTNNVHWIKNIGKSDMFLLLYIDKSYNSETADTYREE